MSKKLEILFINTAINMADMRRSNPFMLFIAAPLSFSIYFAQYTILVGSNIDKAAIEV
jgi:hypothetical protein